MLSTVAVNIPLIKSKSCFIMRVTFNFLVTTKWIIDKFYMAFVSGEESLIAVFCSLTDNKC